MVFTLLEPFTVFEKVQVNCQTAVMQGVFFMPIMRPKVAT
jgi:hypothetical protein